MTNAQEMVDVWCDSTNRWVPGFELRRTELDGSVVVGRPGGAPLPEAIAPARVRRSGRR